MAALFEAYITNLGKYNEGELVGETLKFPTSPQAVEALLKNIGVDGIRYEEFFITSFDGDVLGLYDYLGEYENLDELNHLACLLSELPQSEIEKFEAALHMGAHTSSVADIINLAENLEYFEFYPDIENEDDLGRYYAEDLPIPAELKGYFDYEAYGRDISINEDGHLAPGGYIVQTGDITYESTHDYDEYHFDLDAIEHDPYVLISLLSAWHEGEWTLADVQPTLQMLFDRQYTLTENVVKERRYYIETDTWTDEDGNTHTDSYRVYYDYFICYVTLDNFNLSHLPIYIMGEDKVSRYSLYMATLGNRPDLFPGSSYVGKYTSPPEGYEVPGEYLDDETFAAMLSEAEKYLGYPYVWGGSSPATSFDCSGFVSWVVNHSGWNVGRLGAQGLYNICTRTSSPRPGDLVFFKGTYDTPGVSHCGIYVGDGMMIHCGDPISYANLNSSYWQAHFYAYGRLP